MEPSPEIIMEPSSEIIIELSSEIIMELKPKIIIFIFSANLNALYELSRQGNPNYNEQLHNLLSSTIYEEYKEAISNVLLNSKKKLNH